MKYYVTNNDLIPLHAQPPEGYTKLHAIERAQREAQEATELFNIPINESLTLPMSKGRGFLLPAEVIG